MPVSAAASRPPVSDSATAMLSCRAVSSAISSAAASPDATPPTSQLRSRGRHGFTWPPPAGAATVHLAAADVLRRRRMARTA